jgi:nicotinate-nucleotide adenylyltransferase
MNIGLYFGSFNPIHNGHLQVAQQTLLQRHLDEVWLVVSPQNPFKENSDLAHEEHRLQMATLACEGEKHVQVCNIEFGLPRPSYTVDTIRALIKKHPEHTFHLIIGEDNLEAFERWKEFEALLTLVELVVYPRNNAKPTTPYSLEALKERVHFLHGELIDISATDIRNKARHNKSIEGLTPPNVIEYICANGIYR